MLYERGLTREFMMAVCGGVGGKSSQVKCNVKETFPFSTLLLLLMLRVVYRRVNPLEITSHSINFMTLLMVFV